MPAPPQARIRCRQIAAADLRAVADLLARGFRGRAPAFWMRGFARQGARTLPAGCPTYGYMLESDGTPVGVILLLFSTRDDGPGLRCNLSSWYVEPQFRSYAAPLLSMALKHKNTTYVNISPARHTWSTVQAQGFTRYAQRIFAAVPALSRGVPGTRVRAVSPADAAADADGALLAAHAGFGCISVMCTAPDGAHPFVFVPFRIRAGRIPLPAAQLLYCRNVADFARFAGPLGRYLLKRGFALVLLDADGRLPGLAGLSLDIGRRKYFKGQQAPRPGDLAYTELALFGP